MHSENHAPSAARLQEFLCAGLAARAPALPCGPFAIHPDRHERKTPFLNYAIPTGRAPAAAFAAGLPALIEAFRARDLMPRFKYVEAAAPALAAVLDAAGFTREPETFSMTCELSDLVVLELANEVVHLEPDAPDSDVLATIRMRKLAFEADDSPATEAEIAGFRAAHPAWNHAALRIEGAIVATGSVSAVHAGWAEVAGIATDPAQRRRGYAGAVTAALAQRAFAAGARTVFLTAGDRPAASVYERAGFVLSPLVVAAYRLPHHAA